LAIAQERFALALSNLDPSQWRLFERLANVFMSSEYLGFRPLAAASGDGGADGTLFVLEDDPTVILQFSVRHNTRAKVTETCIRLAETYQHAKVLIYVTNQTLGSDSAQLRRDVRDKYGLYLDIHDREWLVARRNASAANAVEGEALAQAVVDPLLGSPILVERQAQALDDLEAKAAFIYLGLQWQDDTREKGLTKLCFEALVRSVLRDTDSDNRIHRSQVQEMVLRLLPAHPRAQLNQQVDGALARLAKVYIRHWTKKDEFCLTWDERKRLQLRILETSELNRLLDAELVSALTIAADNRSLELTQPELDAALSDARQVVERVLLDRGEAFAVAVTQGHADYVSVSDVEAVTETALSRRSDHSQLIGTAVQAILLAPPEGVRPYLRGLADTYTLFAFMRETPDVQSAVVKMFSDGDIWLDTSVVLPLLAEELLPTPQRAHSELLHAVRECGLRMFITPGVLEELVTHIRRTSGYAQARVNGSGYGAPPFLFEAHQLSGKPLPELGNWLETFCGKSPDEDLLDYLGEEHGIELSSLKEYAESADLAYRAAVAEVWHEARDKRDQRRAALGLSILDQATRHRLVDHDVENYVGVVRRREARGERRSAFGYRTWLFTLDRTTFRVNHRLQESYKGFGALPASPGISSDFMLNYLSIGPVRGRLSRRSEETLPLMLNMSVLDAVPPDLVELAEELRGELHGLSPRVVRRKIKETLEDARGLLGPTAKAGEVGLTDEVKSKLIELAKTR